MPKSNEQINQDLDDLLTSKGYDTVALDSSGKEVPVPDSAALIQFHFHRDGKDYGTVTATIDGLQKLTVYYDDEIANSGIGNSSTVDGDRGMDGTSWISLVKQLKNFSKRHQLGFVLKNSERLRKDMKRRRYNDELKESKMMEQNKLEEGKVKQLADNLKLMSESSFKEVYGITKSDIMEVNDYFRRRQREEEKKEQGVTEGSIEEALQAPPTSTGNELLDEFIGRYVKGGWNYHGINKRGGHEFRKRRYMPAALYGLKDGGVIESHNNGTRVSRFDSSGKRVAKLADGPLSEQGVTDGSDDKKRSVSKKIILKNLIKIAKEQGEQQRVRELESELKKLDQQGVAEDNQMKLDEGYYGNKKMSFSEDTPSVKMIIKHDKTLEETDQRFRHIDSIFLETSDGERFKAPTKKPSRARAFARHIAEGGAYKDDRWNHITEICEDLDKLSGFVRATHNKREQFNESAQRMIGEAQEQYFQLREAVKKLSGSKGYNKYFESYEPRTILEDDTDLSEAFMSNLIDSRIESALPTLSKFGIKMGKINEADEFSNWVNEVVDESLGLNKPNDEDKLLKLLNNGIPFGPNASVVIAELDDIIKDDELYDSLRQAARNDSNADASPQIIAWMQKQDTEQYRRILRKIDTDVENNDGESTDAQAEPAPKKQPAPEKQPSEAPPKGDNGGLPPLPPLAEDDSQLSYIKRLIGNR